MNPFDLILTLILILAVCLAVRSMRRRGTTCGGDCSHCMQGCSRKKDSQKSGPDRCE